MNKRKRTTVVRASIQVLAAVVLTTVLALFFQGSSRPAVRTLHILTTNDVHGRYFDSTYVGQKLSKSLQNISWYVDSVRNAVGEENVLLLDAGDCLQGDNASFYFNFADTLTPHLYPRMARYMGYDAVVVGNHDIETGHSVYDRVLKQLDSYGIPFLAGNAVKADGSAYFPEYKLFNRAGLKVLVLGYTNANIKSWLDESKWRGMDFLSLVPYVQARVKEISSITRPDVTIVCIHSGTGKGDGSELENQGLDLFNSLEGVDFVVCSHDHRPFVLNGSGSCLINSGSRASNLGHGIISVVKDGRRTVSKSLSASMINVRWEKVDQKMLAAFHDDYGKVRDYTLRKVGTLECELKTADAYAGMCDYLNFLHTVQLKATGAEISFAAPLTFNGTVRKGDVVFNDLLTIYPFENALTTMKLSGRQIKDYLEYSYDAWIGGDKDGHVLNIVNSDDPRTGSSRWSFVARSYNFDSVAGIRYEVHPDQTKGERVKIESMADGNAFDYDAVYTVAMTSYRASGGGGLLVHGAGLDPEKLPDMVTGRYPEIRELIYDYFLAHGSVNSELVGDKSLIGEWSFEPASAREGIAEDLKLLFR